MKKPVIIALITFSVVSVVKGQDTILDYYIKKGLESNLTLKQKQLTYEKSLAVLKESKGLFFPNISLNARYTVARGGRVIEFPVGDLLNPVYSALNQLTANLPPPQQFPDIQVQNEEFNFYRPTEHETKLSLHQPLFNSKIYYNYKIQQDMARAGALDVDIYKRELVAEIKKAYYQYLQTHYVLDLMQQTLKLVQENVRVNESLYLNDKVTVDVVESSKAERSKVQQQIAEAEKNNIAARSYINFLLNRPLESDIIVMADPEVQTMDVKMDKAIGDALSNRSEFKLIEAYTAASENAIKLSKSEKIPSLIAAIDYGLQGETYEIDKDADFFLGSLVLKWNLFSGSSNNARIQQAQLEKRILEERRNELEKQVNLEVIRAYYDLAAAEQSIEAARQQKKSASSAFRIVDKKYRQGQANYVRFLEARNSMTNAGENLIITLADYMIKYTELERVTASLKTDNN